MLEAAERIKALHPGSWEFKLEASARAAWGGVFRVDNSEYEVASGNPDQTEITEVEKFGIWEFSDLGIGMRVPWLCDGGESFSPTSLPLFCRFSDFLSVFVCSRRPDWSISHTLSHCMSHRINPS